MQRIFDIENEKDYADLWDILPDEVVKIVKDGRYWDDKYNKYKRKDGSDYTAGRLLNINWHDKTEIARPVNYEDMIGCVGWFDGCGDEIGLGILTKVAPNDEDGYFFLKNNNIWCKTFRPAKKSELKFYGD